MPQDRCGYTYEATRYPDLGSVCCWRPVWEDSDRCIWHADETEKPVRELALRAPDAGDRLDGAVLTRATLDGAEWLSGAVLVDADFEDATAEHVDFSDADLRNANFEDASLRRSDFRGANLEDALLRDTDLNGADFEEARLHEAVFANSYIGRETEFGDTVVYERELFDVDEVALQNEKFDAATWTYRMLQFQFRQNALLERTEQFFVREKDLRRRYAWHQGDYLHAIRAEGSRWLMGYGYRIRGTLLMSLLVIVLGALVYPFVGGVREVSDGTTYALDSPLSTSLPEAVTVLSRTLYFSLFSFTTLGTGDVVPGGFAVRVLSGVEALLGFTLVALLISVLARRQYWL